MRTRPIVAVLAAGLLALGSAGCSGSDSDEPAAGAGSPASDKKITLYSGRSEKLVKPLLEQFTKDTGVSVEARYADTAQLAAQLQEEGDKSRADVFFAQDAGALGAVSKKGLFAPLPNELIGKVPTEYRSKDGTWVGVTGRSRVLVYNSDLVPAAELPKSVFELTDPKWNGKVGIAPTNASFQAFVTAIRVAQGDQKAKDFLAGLKANGVQIRPNNGAIVEDVNNGKLSVGLVNHYYVYEKSKEKGVAVDALKVKLHFFPDGDPGALVNVAGIGVLKPSAADPDVKTFTDYLLGAAAQKYFAESTYEYPLIAGVPTAPGLPPIAGLNPPDVDLNNLDTLAQTVATIKEAGLA
ncbi:MAG TPA: iron ABC transporter substrate-binding protein [Micromonosporaceae bacterium]|nr:iron ABC transporter substrate-binding protein [Micromonosporaceae bacterium]